MADQFGYVVAVDRANGVVAAQLDDGTLVDLNSGGIPYRGPAPPPLSQCWFVEIASGVLICEGPIGNRRVTLHDDFTRVVSPNGDTPWLITLVGAGSVMGSGTTNLDQAGAVSLQTAATNNTGILISKTAGAFQAPTPPAALWYSCKHLLGFTTSIFTDVGFNGVTDDVLWHYDTNSASDWVFRTADGGGTTDQTSPNVPTAGVYQHFDIVFVPDQWAAGWIDGDGPYISETNIADGTASDPAVFVLTRAAAVRNVRTDFVHVELVPNVIDPRLLGTI